MVKLEIYQFYNCFPSNQVLAFWFFWVFFFFHFIYNCSYLYYFLLSTSFEFILLFFFNFLWWNLRSLIFVTDVFSQNGHKGISFLELYHTPSSVKSNPPPWILRVCDSLVANIMQQKGCYATFELGYEKQCSFCFLAVSFMLGIQIFMYVGYSLEASMLKESQESQAM